MSALVEGQIEKKIDIGAGGDGMIEMGGTIIPKEVEVKNDKPSAGGDGTEETPKEIKRFRKPRNQRRIPRGQKGDITDDERSVRSISRRRWRRDSEASTASTKSTIDKVSTIGGFKKYLTSNGHDRRVLYHVSKYIKNRLSLAEYANNVSFLSRCRNLKIIPEEYWQLNAQVRNTKAISDLLDECSYRLMMTNLEYNDLRKMQVSKWLRGARQKLVETLSEVEMSVFNTVLNNEYEGIFARIKEEQRKRVSDLLQTYRANDDRRQNDGGSGSNSNNNKDNSHHRQQQVEMTSGERGGGGGYRGQNQNRRNQNNNDRNPTQGRYARRDDGPRRRTTSGGGGYRSGAGGLRREPQRNAILHRQ